jgi:transcription termination factor Rho
MNQIKLEDLKARTPTELLAFAEEHDIENASAMLKQDMLFAILKRLAENETTIIGEGVVEVLQDGFGFLRSPDANYLPGPDDIYVSPSQIVGLLCALATRWKARSEAQKTASVISRF